MLILKYSDRAEATALLALPSTGGWVTRTVYLFAPSCETSVLLEPGFAETSIIIFSFFARATARRIFYPALQVSLPRQGLFPEAQVQPA